MVNKFEKGIKVFESSGVDPWYAQAILLIESPGQMKKSRDGAYGPFQLMPKVARAQGLTVNRYTDEREDFDRAIDTFDNVLDNHPDAKFLDVILFNYGRCLYRMERRKEARRRFDQLIGDFPESPLAPDAKQISDTLRQSGF